MYVRANKWDQAYQVISRYLPESEYTMLYVQEARKFEDEGDYKNAERMYLAANEPDLAINIYRKRVKQGKEEDEKATNKSVKIWVSNGAEAVRTMRPMKYQPNPGLPTPDGGIQTLICQYQGYIPRPTSSWAFFFNLWSSSDCR